MIQNRDGIRRNNYGRYDNRERDERKDGKYNINWRGRSYGDARGRVERWSENLQNRNKEEGRYDRGDSRERGTTEEKRGRRDKEGGTEALNKEGLSSPAFRLYPGRKLQ